MRHTSELLIDDTPLIVLPSLAVKLNSVDKAVMLQQLQYWLKRSKQYHDGRYWVYNTINAWHDQFPWLAAKTIERYLKYLEKEGLVITGNYNRLKFDRTKWYSIDYEKLSSLYQSQDTDVMSMGTTSKSSNGTANTNGTGLAVGNNTIDYTETNTKTNDIYSGTVDKRPEPQHIPYKEIIDYLNQKTGANYKPNSSANKKLIKARMAEGFTVQDFKTVIDNQAYAWQGRKYWKYMRPSTLFRASKFEGYLNANALDKEKEVPHGGYTGLAPDINDIPDDELPF